MLPLQFENYSIRLLTTHDLDAYFQLVQKNRKRLEDFFAGTVSRTETLEDTKIFLSEITQRAREKTYFPYIIEDNISNRIVGFLDIKNIDWNIPKGELGCYIDEDYASKGIATKAFRTFCGFCFSQHGFEKLFLRTHHSNISARRVAENGGFELEGTIRRDYKTTSGELVDLLYYGRIK